MRPWPALFFLLAQAESIEISKSGKRTAVEGIDLDVHGIEKLKKDNVPQTDDVYA